MVWALSNIEMGDYLAGRVRWLFVHDLTGHDLAGVSALPCRARRANYSQNRLQSTVLLKELQTWTTRTSRPGS